MQRYCIYINDKANNINRFVYLYFSLLRTKTWFFLDLKAFFPRGFIDIDNI